MSHDPLKNTQVQINDQGNSLNIGPAGSMNLSSGSTFTTEDGIGAPNGTGVAVSEQVGVVHKSVITLTGVAIPTTDNGVNGGQGSLKIYDFPQGLVEIVGAEVNLATSVAAGIGATAALVGSLGTAAAGAGDASLTGTEADIHPSIAGTLVGSAGTLVGKSLPTAGSLPGIAAFTDNSAGTASDTLATLPALTDSPASADALRDDLTTNWAPVLRNWIASAAAKIAALLGARRLFDGTGTAKDCYLNLAVPDGDSSANSTVTVTGTVTLHWINHGDV